MRIRNWLTPLIIAFTCGVAPADQDIVIADFETQTYGQWQATGAFDAGVLFAFFCFMIVLQLVWVKFMVPQTKGVSLEEMQEKLGIRPLRC